MKVLVTGAGGFIGGAVVAALKARGCETVAGARRGGGTLCDLDDPRTLPPALEGAGAVVHCAYGDLGAMARQTQTLLSAMTKAGARRLVFLSSISVYGEAEGVIDETAALMARDPYGAAKVACEKAIRRWDGEAAILRPGVVYGAGSRFWTIKLAERIRAGAWGDFGALGEGVAPLLHVDDLAIIVAQLALAREAVTLNAVGPETPSWNRYFAALAEALGAGPLPRLTPAELRRRSLLSRPAKVWRRLGLPGAAALALAPTAGELALFARRAVYATDAAERMGLTPRIGLAEGLRRSC